MDIKTAIDEMKRNPGPVLHRVLQRDGQSRGLALDDYTRGGYICPVCGSGMGREKNPDGTPKKEKGTGIKCHVVDGVPRFTCFAGHCFSNASIIDLIAIQHGLDPEDATQTGKIVALAATEFGITIDEKDTPSPTGRKTRSESENAKRDLTHPKMKTSPQNAQNGPKTGDIDLRQKFEQCRAHLDDSSPRAYLTRRGLSVETARALGIGYDPDYSTMVIPLNSDTYLYRYINPDGTPRDELQSSGATAYPFNAGALKQSEPVFIVEGWKDAVSVAMCDGQAIALNSTQHTAALLSIIDKRTERGGSIPPIVLALDSDDAGRQCMERLRNALTERGIPCIYRDLCTGITDAGGTAATDPNEALQWDPDALRDNVAAGIQLAMEQAGNGSSLQADKPETPIDPGIMERLERSNRGLEWYAEIIERIKAAEYGRITSGFVELDRRLGGGMYPGFYVVGGMTGTGKTSFVLQIADHIAAQGRPVLYISLEMSGEELTAKSVARLLYEANPDATEIVAWGQILEYNTVAGGAQVQSRDRQARILDGMFRYCTTIGKNTHVIEGVADTTAENVRTLTAAMTQLHGIPPVVIVDYLQIMASPSDRLTDKQAADRNVLELKRISRDFKTPVIAISSFNRASYTLEDKQGKPLQGKALMLALMSGFKESGATEYTADGLLALTECENNGYNYSNWIDVDLYVLKNRRGVKKMEPLELSWRGDASAFVSRGIRPMQIDPQEIEWK